MDLGKFHGPEDIEKSKVAVSRHAIKRYAYHCSAEGKDLLVLEKEIRGIFQKSSHRKAATPLQKINAVIKHRQETFFFRYKKWQFRLARYRKKFIIKTIILLDERKYQQCLNS